MGKAPTNGGYPIFIFDYQKVSLSWFLVSCHLLEAPFPMAEPLKFFKILHVHHLSPRVVHAVHTRLGVFSIHEPSPPAV